MEEEEDGEDAEEEEEAGREPEKPLTSQACACGRAGDDHAEPQQVASEINTVLPDEAARRKPLFLEEAPGRGLHSFTSQLNLSAFHGIGGARVKAVLRGVYGVKVFYIVSDTVQVELRSGRV
jgi:hypothetical protein